MDISKLRKKAKEQQAAESRQRAEGSGKGLVGTTQTPADGVPDTMKNAPSVGEKAPKPTFPPGGVSVAVPVSTGQGAGVPAPDSAGGAVQESKPLLELAQEELKKYPAVSGEKELLCFPLGGQEYGIELSSVREIIRVKEITPVPNTADFILGIIVLRGEIIPVIDLRKRIGLSFLGFTPATRFIMVSFAESMTGLVVDSIPDVKKVSVESIQPAELIGTVDVKFITGISTSRGGFTILLKLEEILRQSDMLKACL